MTSTHDFIMKIVNNKKIDCLVNVYTDHVSIEYDYKDAV